MYVLLQVAGSEADALDNYPEDQEDDEDDEEEIFIGPTTIAEQCVRVLNGVSDGSSPPQTVIQDLPVEESQPLLAIEPPGRQTVSAATQNRPCGDCGGAAAVAESTSQSTADDDDDEDEIFIGEDMSARELSKKLAAVQQEIEAGKLMRFSEPNTKREKQSLGPESLSHHSFLPVRHT